MTLHSVGWFVMCAMMLVTSIGAAMQSMYVAGGCYGVAALLSGWFCFETAQDDNETD